MQQQDGTQFDNLSSIYGAVHMLAICSSTPRLTECLCKLPVRMIYRRALNLHEAKRDFDVWKPPIDKQCCNAKMLGLNLM